MAQTITIEIDPSDYGYEADVFDEYEIRSVLRVFDLAEEAARHLKGNPLAISLRDALDRAYKVRQQFEKPR